MRTIMMAVVLAGLCGAAGCYRTTYDFGTVPAYVSTTHDEKWHHNFIEGIVEGSSPEDLTAACQQGSVSQVSERVSFMNALLSLVLRAPTAGALALWTPRTVTVTCSASSVPPATLQAPPPVEGSPDSATRR